MQSFRYRTYGLNVESEIACPDLLPWVAEPQVRIRYGRPPGDKETLPHEFGWRLSSETEFLLRLKGVGRFWVSRGEEIQVEPAEDATDEQVQACAFGSIFGILLHQRRQLPLHASAIATDRGAVLFAGSSGYGKSTTAGELSRRGYGIVADDICALTTVTGISHVHPGRAAIHLTADSLERLEMARGAAIHESHNPMKSMVAVGGPTPAAPMPIRTVYVLRPTESAPIRLTRVSGSEKLEMLAANVFRPYLSKEAEVLTALFQEFATLAQSANVVIVERPARPFLLAELADRIEEDLKQSR